MVLVHEKLIAFGSGPIPHPQMIAAFGPIGLMDLQELNDKGKRHPGTDCPSSASRLSWARSASRGGSAG